MTRRRSTSTPNYNSAVTALLHAELKEEVFVGPPMEFYPNGGVLWKLRKAMCGLKAAPMAWQYTSPRL